MEYCTHQDGQDENRKHLHPFFSFVPSLHDRLHPQPWQNASWQRFPSKSSSTTAIEPSPLCALWRTYGPPSSALSPRHLRSEESGCFWDRAWTTAPGRSRLKGKKEKKNKYMGRMLWNFGQGLWKSTSPKCVVTHLFHFPLPSECLQKDSDWRVYSAPLPSDDPASPSHCANWAVRFFFFCARSRGGLMSDILFLCMLANPPVLNQWLDARLLFLTGHDIQHLFMFPFSFRDIIRKFWRCIVQYYQCCKQSAKHKYKEDMLLFILSSFISLNPFN